MGNVPIWKQLYIIKQIIITNGKNKKMERSHKQKTLNNKKEITEKTKVNDLEAVKTVLDKHKINFWLDCGALLGTIRNGRLIEWDHDIDLGAWCNDIDKITKALEEINKEKYRVKINEKARNIIIVDRVNGKDFCISIQLYEKKGEKAMKKWLIHTQQALYNGNSTQKNQTGKTRLWFLFSYLLWVFSSPRYINEKPWFMSNIGHKTLIKIAFILPKKVRTKIYEFIEKVALKTGWTYIKIEVPLKYFQKLKTIDFYDIKIKVPSDPEGYLAYRYGNDWRTPKRKWIFYKDYACLSSN